MNNNFLEKETTNRILIFRVFLASVKLFNCSSKIFNSEKEQNNFRQNILLEKYEFEGRDRKIGLLSNYFPIGRR